MSLRRITRSMRGSSAVDVPSLDTLTSPAAITSAIGDAGENETDMAIVAQQSHLESATGSTSITLAQLKAQLRSKEFVEATWWYEDQRSKGVSSPNLSEWGGDVWKEVDPDGYAAWRKVQELTEGSLPISGPGVDSLHSIDLREDKFDGKSFRNMQMYICLLKAYRHGDTERIIIGSNNFEGKWIQRDWVRVLKEHDYDITRVTWDEFNAFLEKHLEENIGPRHFWGLDAISALLNRKQQPGEPLYRFIDDILSIRIGFPYDFPEQFYVQLIYSMALPECRRRIIDPDKPQMRSLIEIRGKASSYYELIEAPQLKSQNTPEEPVHISHNQRRRRRARNRRRRHAY